MRVLLKQGGSVLPLLVVFCSLFTTSCSDGGGIPGNVETFVSGRGLRIGGSWSRPTEISIMSRVEGVQTFVLGLEPARDGLLLLLSTPDDPFTRPAQRHALTIVRNNGSEWTIQGVVRGSSQFHRASAISLPAGDRIFWSGDPPGEVPPLPYPPTFRTFVSSTVYTCMWQDTQCARVDSASHEPRNFVDFSQVVEYDGDQHVVYENSLVYHVRATASGVERLGFAGGTSPSLLRLPESLLIVAAGRVDGEAGWGLVTRRWNSTTWSSPSTVFRDVSESVERTAGLLSEAGVVHIAWMTRRRSGEIILYHASSTDLGINWSERQEVFRHPSLYSRSPMFIEGIYGQIHLVWGHHATPPKQRTFHSVLTGGAWSEPEELFVNFPTTSTRKVAKAPDGTIHLVFQSDSTFYDSVYQ